MKNINRNTEDIIKHIYNGMFVPFFMADFRVFRNFIFIDNQSIRNNDQRYTFELMLNPDIISGEVDLISLEINIIKNKCEIFFFANDGNIFLNETEVFQCVEELEVLIKSYATKFFDMFETMILPYTTTSRVG